MIFLRWPGCTSAGCKYDNRICKRVHSFHMDIDYLKIKMHIPGNIFENILSMDV